MFKDKLKAELDSIKPSPSLEGEILLKIEKAKEKKEKRGKNLCIKRISFAVVCLVAVTVAVFSLRQANENFFTTNDAMIMEETDLDYTAENTEESYYDEDTDDGEAVDTSTVIGSVDTSYKKSAGGTKGYGSDKSYGASSSFENNSSAAKCPTSDTASLYSYTEDAENTADNRSGNFSLLQSSLWAAVIFVCFAGLALLLFALRKR